MILRFSPKAAKAYQKFPLRLQEKADKQFHYLRSDYRHPSLRSRKMAGEEKYEARIDYHNRFTFLIIDNETILSLGPHDTGLGKK